MSRADKFPWGRILQTHVVGPYKIVEYAEKGADNHPTHPREETGVTLYHVSHSDSWGGNSYGSLDEALIGAIDARINSVGSRAYIYACKCLGVENL